ncbi:nSTAND1 domain-containing NTPase [Brunnivagina elsteri]|uniref:ATP-binding protein n=1 Tax=Brunnivagina elsteri CCALA 953 TaxID=987040 RepID=A0A2A2TJ59_9CYAN|nr:ATP-binding protein [Calothrix elsteri]PAX54900.1 ATP-binding protein [Calothrix elsteri CCALA 953]
MNDEFGENKKKVEKIQAIQKIAINKTLPSFTPNSSLEELAWTLEASQGEFRLILARCNYLRLRSRLLRKLQKLTTTNIQLLTLKKTDNSLYKKIFRYSQHKDALMVWGLESVQDLEKLLIATNQVREEFRKNFNFPVVLWVTDDVLAKIIRIASDFESWTTTIEFRISTDELIQTLQHDTDAIFNIALVSDKYSIGWQMGYLRRSQIIRFYQDSQLIFQQLEPGLQASVYFAMGQDAYLKNQIDTALDFYQKSLEHWVLNIEDDKVSLIHTPKSPILRAGILLFYIGLCYFQKGEENVKKSRDYLLQAKSYFQQCITIFTEANQLNLVTKFINPLGEVLQRLKAWDDLQSLAKTALDLQKLYSNPTRVARAYGFLAEVAISRELWLEAKQNIYQALHYGAKSSPSKQQNQGLYLLLLAEAELNLGQIQLAEKHLQLAQNINSEEYPQQYIRILQKLRSHYWHKHDYLEAFRAKQEIRSIEQQYGFRAFIGAGKIQPYRKHRISLTQIIETDNNNLLQVNIAKEITASRRKNDVEKLLERIARLDYKLIVIHGYSGVGKTSLVQAGLVPALKLNQKNTCEIIPILINFYPNWVNELEKKIAVEFNEGKSQQVINKELLSNHLFNSNYLYSLENILKKLQECHQNNLRIVLIFDEFEEFIFTYNTRYLRQHFFDFLGKCLNILNVKVILSLRQEYLHYLLECNHIPSMDIINHDILCKNILYEIGNFTPDEAKSLIKCLSEHSNYPLETKLIEKLVEDLSAKFGEVRPIELQIVGAQLQTEKITTLAQYQQYENHKQLVNLYLQEVVKDCGQENQQIAEMILDLLADEKGIRLIKKRSELIRDLKLIVTQNNQSQENSKINIEDTKIDLIFQIFVASGIVVLISNNLDDRIDDQYQLVHDYLAGFIQKQQRPKLHDLINQLNQEKQQDKNILNHLNNLNSFYKIALMMTYFIILGLLILR